MALARSSIFCRHGECARGTWIRFYCASRAASSCESIEEKDRAELYRLLAKSRDREVRALKLALEARKCEMRAIEMLNQRLKIDASEMKDEISGGHSRELRALRTALIAQERENLRIMDVNREFQQEIEMLKGGKLAAEENQDRDEIEPFDRCFITVSKPREKCGDITIGSGTNESIEELSCEEKGRTSEEQRREQPLHAVASNPAVCEERVSQRFDGEAVKLVRPRAPENVDLEHPWPEWVLFMDYLKKSFDLKADNTNMEEAIKASAMSFAATHENLIQRVSQEDLMVFGAFGCPNTDRKIVNSGKRLRKYLKLAESDVCRFCSHSDVCSRAQCEGTLVAESSDVLWLLLQFGFDAVISHPEKRPLPEHVEKVIKSLFKQLVFLADNPHATVKHSQDKEQMDFGNWKCTRCSVLNFSGSKLCRECGNPCGHDTLKSGDWKCIKCSVKNPARNVICQDCSAPRPPKELRWGDWECPKCQGVNFARNKECFRCNSKQPPFKERQLIGVNKNTILDAKPTGTFTLGVTPWLMSKEEREASVKKI